MGNRIEGEQMNYDSQNKDFFDNVRTGDTARY